MTMRNSAVPLADLCSLISRGISPAYDTDGIPVLSQRCIRDNRVLFDVARITNPTKKKVSQEKKLRQYDVLINSTGVGTLGRVAQVKKLRGPATVDSHVTIVRPDDNKVDPLFLGYAMVFNQPNLESMGEGATGQTELSRTRLAEKVMIHLPARAEQRRIASILSAYDDLIENNLRRIKILEEMARALYREWFVEFRFPGHENITHINSEIGSIPKGWEVKTLGELVTCNRRSAKPDRQLSNRRYVPIDCLPLKSLTLMEAKPIEEAQSSLQLFEKGDILFGAMRAYFHKVVVAPFSGITRTTCFVFQPKQPKWSAFATMTLFEESTVAYASSHSQGATIPYAVWDGSLSEMPIIFPADELLKQFERTVAPMLLGISQSFFTLTNLRQTRDLLLPRLLSGQVPIAETAIAA